MNWIVEKFTVKKNTKSGFNAEYVEVGELFWSIYETDDRKLIGMGGVGQFTLVSLDIQVNLEKGDLLVKEDWNNYIVTRVQITTRKYSPSRVVISLDHYNES